MRRATRNALIAVAVGFLLGVGGCAAFERLTDELGPIAADGAAAAASAAADEAARVAVEGGPFRWEVILGAFVGSALSGGAAAWGTHKACHRRARVDYHEEE